MSTGPGASPGDEYIAGSAIVLLARKHERYYWGKRYFATFLVRPIPRQLWPTKYDDVGAAWMDSSPGSAGFTPAEWRHTLGFATTAGSAGGLVADLFLEFSWGAILACFVIGKAYGWVWHRWVTVGGFWTVLYLEMLVLSVYLPSQSVGAWLYRLMLLGGPSWLVWRTVVGPGTRAAGLPGFSGGRNAICRQGW